MADGGKVVPISSNSLGTLGELEPGFPVWVTSTPPKAAGILAEAQIARFTRRVPCDPAARLQPSA